MSEANNASIGERMADRLDGAHSRNFVGRAEETNLFRSALQGGPGEPVLLLVHGPGGIGKTTFLQHCAVLSRAAGRAVVWLDSRNIVPRPDAFAEAAAEAAHLTRPVLFVDTFERLQEMQGWLRDSYLPQLPSGALIVLAGRLPFEPQWETSLGWGELTRTVLLRDLAPGDAMALLERRGVERERRAPLHAFAGGHPLALRLAAAVSLRAEANSEPAIWAPTPEVVETLLGELIGEVPSMAHRRALEICAYALTTTEGLLQAVLGEHGPQLFAWLRQLPFIEAGSGGLYPHDVVRDILETDLRWRNPERRVAMDGAIRSHMIQRARTVTGSDGLRAAAAFNHLQSKIDWVGRYLSDPTEPDVFEAPYEPGDRDALLRITEQVEGVESARLVDQWLRRQPEGFHVHRRTGTGELIGFLGWLRLHPDEDAENSTDPVVAAVWEHIARHGPLRPGEHVAVARFLINSEAYQRPSRSWDLLNARTVAEILHAERCGWTATVLADPDFWQPLMDYCDHPRSPVDAKVGDRSYALFCHDWRAIRVDEWLERIKDRLQPGQSRQSDAGATLLVLSRADFGDAVRHALRSWHDDSEFAATPLARSRLVATGESDDPIRELRSVLSSAIDALSRNPRTVDVHAALKVTFLDRTRTQEDAARRLAVSFSTYRRHLARGLEMVSDRLWELEMHG
ncbi:ATP-binding protein [Streptomyces sp. NPDC087844]|uniref:ATP-binding protein n=1 Tax=Streptomyces sp. NPDC087844 TaxID=3365805 RepID=UPI0037FA47B6